MPRRSVQVCVRTRPTANFAQDELFVDPSSNTIAVNQDKGPHEAVDGPNNQQSAYRFQFHHVLHNTSQETVYDSLARDVVQGVADGINGTIMSYGQTGSGKTFTMVGDTSNFVHRGIAPRALGHIFSEVNMRMETQFTVTCTYMEIYNEKIFDLLEPMDGPSDKEGATGEFTVAEDKGGRGVHVRGLTEKRVNSEQEALNLLFAGELGRTTAQHKLNRRSNRSHSIFTVYIAQRSKSGVSEKVLHSKMSLVDLAGSERLKKTMEGEGDGGAALDDTLKKESMHINQSLTYLEQCVVALSRRSPTGAPSGHVPYRQTKLTAVLKDALGGNCNTLLCACIWGESAHLEETISTLRLASRMMRVQNQSLAVEVTDPVKLVKKQEQTIKELKQELLMHDALADRAGVLYDPYTPEQLGDLKQTLVKFLSAKGGSNGDDDDALLGSFQSVRQMRETCKLFRELYQQQEDQTRRLVTAAQAGSLGGLGATSPAELEALLGGTGVGGAGGEAGPTVGDLENGGSGGGGLGGGGFGLGMADPSARPVAHELAGTMGSSRGMGSSNNSPTRQRPGSRGGGAGGGGGSNFNSHGGGGGGGGRGNGRTGGVGWGGAGAVPEDKDAAFLVFKSGAGKATNSDIQRANAQAKQLKAKSKACAGAINESKRVIDELTSAIEEKKQTRLASLRATMGSGGFGGPDGVMEEDVVDEEEFRLMKKVREAKKSYRAAYEDLANIQGEMESVAKETSALKSALLSTFEEWHASALADAQPRDPFGDTRGGEDERSELDDQEAFEALELEREAAERGGDSVPFFQAQKTQRATATQNHVALRQMHKNKRNH